MSKPTLKVARVDPAACKKYQAGLRVFAKPSNIETVEIISLIMQYWPHYYLTKRQSLCSQILVGFRLSEQHSSTFFSMDDIYGLPTTW